LKLSELTEKKLNEYIGENKGVVFLGSPEKNKMTWIKNNILEKINKAMRFSIIARGFPDNAKLISYVKNRVAEEVILITSLSKIKKIEKGIEKCEQRIYNVPFRDNLKILYTANVSRET